MVTILMVAAERATLCLLKVRAFRNKGYVVIILSRNYILSRDYIVNVTM